MSGTGWSSGWGTGTAPAGSNPFPGAVAGVYRISGTGDFVERAAYSVDYDGDGVVWVTGGSNAWRRVLSPPVIADVGELPVAAAEEVFDTSCLLEDNAGNLWRGNGGGGWVRISCAPVADVMSLPEPETGEEFPTGLLCLTQDLGVVYYWSGSAWVVPS